MAFLSTSSNALGQGLSYKVSGIGRPLDIRSICENESDITSSSGRSVGLGPGIIVYVTSTKLIFVIDELDSKTRLVTGYHEIGSDSPSISTATPTPYDDSELVKRIEALEATTHQPTTVEPIIERIETLESTTVNPEELNSTIELLQNQINDIWASTHEPTTVEPLIERIEKLEAKEDKDTIYNDTDLLTRVSNLENCALWAVFTGDGGTLSNDDNLDVASLLSTINDSSNDTTGLLLKTSDDDTIATLASSNSDAFATTSGANDTVSYTTNKDYVVVQ